MQRRVFSRIGDQNAAHQHDKSLGEGLLVLTADQLWANPLLTLEKCRNIFFSPQTCNNSNHSITHLPNLSSIHFTPT